MRDPRRIQRVLNRLEHVWNANPDMRLGQLYANLVGHHGDVFYIEDDEVETALDAYRNGGGWGAFTDPKAGKNQ